MAWKCPDCASTMDLPEALEGGGTRCSVCLAEFGSPGAQSGSAGKATGPVEMQPSKARRSAGARRVVAFGELFSESLSIWSKGLGRFLLLSFVIYSPLVLFVLYFASHDPAELTVAQMQSLETAQTVIGFPLQYIAVAALTTGVIASLLGKSESLGSMLGTGVRRAIPAFWTALVSVVIVAIPAVPVVLWVALASSGGGGSGGLNAIIMAILAIIALVGVVLLSLKTAVALPASVVERQNGWPAVKRSFALTKGHLSVIFSLLFVIGILVGVAGFVAGLFLPWPISLLVSVAIQIVGSSLSSVAIAVLYFRLRSRLEGIGVEQFSSVFD